MPPKHQLFTVLAACFISSCSIGPDYIKPAIPVKQHSLKSRSVLQKSTAVWPTGGKVIRIRS